MVKKIGLIINTDNALTHTLVKEFDPSQKESIYTLRDAGLAVLSTKDCFKKANLTEYFIKKW